MKLTDRDVGAMRLAFVLLSVCFLALFGCSKNPASSNLGQRIFYTSFERDADTAGWKGITPTDFVDDPAPDCGSRSLRTGGGCVQPDVYTTLGPFEQDGYYRFSVWGKSLSASAPSSVMLVVDGDYPRGDNFSVIVIEEQSWRFLVAHKVVFCPANRPLQLQLRSGGFAGSRMVVDGLALYHVGGE